MHKGAGYPLNRIDLVKLQDQPLDVLDLHIAEWKDLKRRGKVDGNIRDDNRAGCKRQIIDRRVGTVGKEKHGEMPWICSLEIGFQDSNRSRWHRAMQCPQSTSSLSDPPEQYTLGSQSLRTCVERHLFYRPMLLL